MRALHLLLLAALLGVASSAGQGAIPAPSGALALDVVAVACDNDDGVCLAYANAIPGPTIELALGEMLAVTLTNRIAETIAPLAGPADVKARLAQSSVSLHTHGLATSVAMDGMPAHAGTAIPDSSAAPGASFTYVYRTPFPGVWHYHDHVIGADGSEGVARGLFGTIIVRNGPEPRADRVIDAHVLDEGLNGPMGLDEQVAVGSSFDVAITGMGNWVWTVSVTSPDGFVDSVAVGPGVSERVRVADAQPGVYAVKATTGFLTYRGEVRAS